MNDKRVIKSSINLFHLKQIVESEGLMWDWVDTPEELIDLERVKMKESLHSKLPFRVHKYHNKQYKQGFYYQYYYKNNDENIEMFSSVNLYKLKDLVESENLPWDWLNTPESLKKANLMSYDKFSDDGRGRVRDEYGKEENDEVNLPYRVIKHSTDDNRNGFQYKYKYYENKVSRTLSSFNLIKLEKKVKEHNLEWDWLNTSQELIIKHTEDYEKYKHEQEVKKLNTKLKNIEKEKKVKQDRKTKTYKYSVESKNKMSEAHRKFSISDAVNIRNDFNKGFSRTRLMNKYGLDEARLNNIFLFIENNPIKILEYEDEHKKGKYPRYIEKNTAGNYSVRLVQNQKRTYIGSYPSLEIAVGVRNILVQYNFFLPSEIIRYNDQYWVIMINDSGKFEYKGHYPTLEEAKSVVKEVDMSCIVLQKNNTYLINKSINDKVTYFGTYYTLEEAVKARDDYRLHDWSVDYFKEVYEENPITKNKNIYFYRNKYNVIKNFSNGSQKHYGAFKTFEEACKVRDELKKNNWDRVEDPDKDIEKWGKEDYHIVRVNPTGNVRYDYGGFETLDAARIRRDVLGGEGFPKSEVVNIIRDMNYIHHRHTKYGDRFGIEKNVDGKRRYFGSFRKLGDAKIVRDLLELYDWNILESDVFRYGEGFVALFLNSKGTFEVLGVYSEMFEAVNVLNDKLGLNL